MSESAVDLGAWSARKGEPDGADIAYVQSLLAKHPVSAIARMCGRSEAFVRQVAELCGAKTERPTAVFVPCAQKPQPPANQNSPRQVFVPPSTAKRPGTRQWRQSLPPRVKRIIAEIAASHGVGYEEVVSPSGAFLTRKYTRARQEAYAAIYELRDDQGERRYGLPLIGSWFGGRDHTTVLMGIRRHQGISE